MGSFTGSVDADFEESQHPRRDDGKFGSGGGGAPKGGSPKGAPSQGGAGGGPMSLKDMKKVGPKPGGTLPGAVYEDGSGARWLVKHPKTPDHARNEVLAGRLYEAAGVKVPELRLVDGGSVASRMVDGFKDDRKAVKAGPEGLGRGLPVDAWLGNWDVAGLDYDNVGFVDGEPVRIDLGGALRYRAQGAPKGAAFGPKVTEMKTLRDAKTNPQSAAAFSGTSVEELQEGAADLARVTDATIDALVKELGPGGEGDAELAATLKARRDDVLRQLGVGKTAGDEAAPAAARNDDGSPEDPPDRMTWGQGDLELLDADDAPHTAAPEGLHRSRIYE